MGRRKKSLKEARFYDELIYDACFNSVRIYSQESIFVERAFAGIHGGNKPLTIARVEQWLREENYKCH